MKANAKRSFSVLATVSLLAVIILGITALTTVPVSAPYVTTESKRVELTPNSGTSGNVGDTMSFTVKVYNVQQTRWEGPTPPGFIPEGSGSEGPASGVSGTVSFSTSGGSTESASYVTDSSGSATVTHAFSQAGTYTVYAHSGVYSSNGVAVVIAAAPTQLSPSPDGGGGSSSPTPNGGGSGSESSPTPNTSVAGIGNIAAQVESATGLGSNWLIIVLAVIIVVILAIIATALLMRRGGGGQ